MAAPDTVRAWFQERADIADGGIAGAPVAGPRAVEALLAEPRERDQGRTIRLDRCTSRAWPLLEAGLLRQFCAMSFEQIAHRVGCGITVARDRYCKHLEANGKCEDYHSDFVDFATQLLAR